MVNKFYLQDGYLVGRREKPNTIHKLSVNRRCCCCNCSFEETLSYIRKMSLTHPYGGTASFEDPFFEIGPYWCREKPNGATDCDNLIGIFCGVDAVPPGVVPAEPDRTIFATVQAILGGLYIDSICEPCDQIEGFKTICDDPAKCLSIFDPRKDWDQFAVFYGYIYADTLDLVGSQACNRCSVVGATATLYGSTFLTENQTADLTIQEIFQGDVNCANL